MQRVFVLDKNKQPLMPCHPARARELLGKRKAAVFRLRPFTIILQDRDGGCVQPIELKTDPGSRTTGIVLVALFQGGRQVIWAGNLHHRGLTIRESLDHRRAMRRGRRNRKTRYRPPRFDNRRKPDGWLPPSLMSRVNNVLSWGRKLTAIAPVSEVHTETVRFDTQSLERPEISGVEYQQGTLFGYEIREYVLEKWGRKCAYCDATNVPLEIEHIVARSKSGSNRPSNLTLSCVRCNQAKGNQSLDAFLAHDPKRLTAIKAYVRAPLKDAAAVNATRFAIGAALKILGVPVSFWSGGRTKFNRTAQGYAKDHWIDAACVGETGADISISNSLKPLEIKATGRGKRQVCRVDRFGFPRTAAGRVKRVHDFQTGDLVELNQPLGKYAGQHRGRLAGIRAKGQFDIAANVGKITANWKRFKLLQRSDGYAYAA